ncbi:MAG: hypothetical protein Q4B26_03500 [Eubacteriales bacterium]|nr:hypothetical protein [Eubacteriales bacterium]
MECRKVYVDVTLDITKDGDVRPRKLRYEDGSVYEVQQLKEVHKNTASTKVGGLGTRYTVVIRGHEAYLFDESGRWFVEANGGSRTGGV